MIWEDALVIFSGIVFILFCAGTLLYFIVTVIETIDLLWNWVLDKLHKV